MENLYYPARTQWAHLPVAEVVDGEVALRGRILDVSGGKGKLQDQTGEIELNIGEIATKVKSGDIVELAGSVVGGKISVSAIRLLTPVVDAWQGGDWQRFRSSAGNVRENIAVRARILHAIHCFFASREFVAVETPTLSGGSAQEEQIQLFATEYRQGKTIQRVYLAPSPELYMKRLLGVGMERIYQITRSFRNGELGPLHNPEFAILEWYRAYASYEEVMVDIEQLVAYVTEKTTGKPSIIRQGQVVDLTPPWPRISVHEAFERWAGIDLQICPEVGNLFSRAVALGYASVTPQDSWEDIFHKIFLEQIEPNLASMGTVHLLDYPRQLAALAKQKEEHPAVVERTEAFVGGVELTNGYTELNDPTEQRGRFTTGHEQSAVDGAPIDQAFLDAMECGFPPAGGVALGVDRLVMLIAGADRLDEVIAFPMGL